MKNTNKPSHKLVAKTLLGVMSFGVLALAGTPALAASVDKGRAAAKPAATTPAPRFNHQLGQEPQTEPAMPQPPAKGEEARPADKPSPHAPSTADTMRRAPQSPTERAKEIKPQKELTKQEQRRQEVERKRLEKERKKEPKAAAKQAKQQERKQTRK